jgi:hypothetical protein
MRVLIVTSCTGHKAVDHDRKLTIDDFRAGPQHVAAREQELAELLTPAGEMYTGQQHLRLMRGVRAFREKRGGKGGTISLRILSAGYGLVPGDRRLAPYDCTFEGMTKRELREWAAHLHVPAAIRKILAEPFDLGVVLLGERYLEACALDDTVHLGGPALMFTSAKMAKRLPELPSLRFVVLTHRDATRFSCGLVALKGEVAGRILTQISKDPSFAHGLRHTQAGVLDLLAPKQGLPRRARAHTKRSPAVDPATTSPSHGP